MDFNDMLDNMELGNLLWGHSRGKYPLMYRDKMSDCKEWNELLDIVHCDSYGHEINPEECNKMYGYSCELFEINPYYWGDCDCGADDEVAKLMAEEKFEEANEIYHKPTCSLCIPNFIYHGKDGDFTLMWYKYPFRDTYMNLDLKYEELVEIFKSCIKFVKDRDSAKK